MFKFYGWFLNRKVLPDTGLRIFLLFRYRVETNPHLQAKKTLQFSRRDLGFSTGLSYNSIQDGIKQLTTLGLIQLDPLGKGSKQWVRLTETTEYKWDLIQERLGFHFKPTDTDKK
jgi:hypothetical protein